MLPDAGRQDLLYVSAGSSVYVYAYKTRELVGTLIGFQTPQGECATASGNVFITDSTSNQITEYRHGATRPVTALADFDDSRPLGCSVNPSNGDVCVANFNNASISVFTAARGKPRVYSTKGIVSGDATCAYDGKGDMFVAGPNDDISGISQFAYLPKGATSFVRVNPLPASSWTWINVWSVQWDGEYWEIADDGAFRFTIEKNGAALYEGTTNLPGISSEAQAWIVKFNTQKGSQGSQIVAVNNRTSGSVHVWTYPKGEAVGSITDGLTDPFGVTLSLAPK
jgi:DNA-binding beta-propeller fold protein YncE